MADFNPSNTIDSQLANLPPEYAEKIAKLLRQQQMGQMGMQMGIQGLNAPTQFTGGQYNYAVKKSPLATLAQGLQMYLGQKGISEADKGIAGVRTQAAEDQRADLSEALGVTDPSARIARMLSSKFPGVQAQGKEERKRLDAQLGKVADVTKDIDPRVSVAAAMGNGPPPGWGPPELKQPETRWLDDPNNPGKKLPQTINYDLRGQGKATLGAQGSSVSVENKLAGREGEKLIDANVEQLTKGKDRARQAQEVLANNARIIEELEAGAKTGGGEGYKQSLRKAFQAFGVTLPETGPTEVVKNALAENIFAKAAALRPISNEEKQFLLQQVGSIDTDPQALANIMAWYSGSALKAIQEFEQQKGEMSKDSKFGAQYSAMGAGVGMPQQLFGPTWFKLLQLKNLQRQGGDLSAFQVGDEPVGVDAQINVRPPSYGLGKPPAPSAGGLSPAEQAELEALRKKYGR